MPSAFIAATASPRALNCCADSTCRGSSSVDSMTDSDVEGVAGRLPVEQLDRGQGERRQRLVEREVELQVDGEPDQPALVVGLGEPLDHAAGEQRAVDRDGPADVPALGGAVLVVVGQQVPHRGERVAAAGRSR